MFRLKDIIYLCEQGLKDARFIAVDHSKKAVEVRNGIPGFVCGDEFDPVKNYPEVIDEWQLECWENEYSYLYILQPFYREVMDFYFR